MTDEYTKNKIIYLDATVTPQPGITVETYEWKIDEVLNSNKTSRLTINTSDLSLGLHKFSLRVLNSCGSWSEYATVEINIINEVKMEKIVNIIVDEAIETVSIVMDTVGRVDVTVTNTAGAAISGATLDLDGVSTGLTTDVDGKASIPNVPYGSHTIKATKVID